MYCFAEFYVPILKVTPILFATKTIPHGSEKSYCEEISEMNTTLLTSNPDIENLQELKWLSVELRTNLALNFRGQS